MCVCARAGTCDACVRSCARAGVSSCAGARVCRRRAWQQVVALWRRILHFRFREHTVSSTRDLFIIIIIILLFVININYLNSVVNLKYKIIIK